MTLPSEPPSNGHANGEQASQYSTLEEAKSIFETLVQDRQFLPIHENARTLSSKVTLTSKHNSQLPFLPCPYRQTEVITALKGIEASAANALAEARFGFVQDASIVTEHASLFLLMAYVASIDGLGKYDEGIKKRLRDTDIFQGQSNLYRRCSANVYLTKDRRYFHLHGSLEATPTLNMIGLPGYNKDLTDYEEVIRVIEEHCQQFDAQWLEDTANEKYRQAGVICRTVEEFHATEHGKILAKEPLFSVNKIAEADPAPFPPQPEKNRILGGFKVLDLTRIIAGPTIGRSLAEYGAEVIRITSPNLPDVPLFQVDGNLGKTCAELNLKNAADRKCFEDLLMDADVVIDGYRPGAITKLGYGPKQIATLFKERGRKTGVVYVAEDCYGFTGPWKERAGWQQIADCVSGLAWAQGRAMGLDEPVVPPFPMSDYGAGCMATIGVLTALHRRASEGGSYFVNTSLLQYDNWLLSLGQYPPSVWRSLLGKVNSSTDGRFSKLRHCDIVDVVSKVALDSMHQLAPFLFDDDSFYDTLYSEGFKGQVRFCRPVVKLSKTRNGFDKSSAPNGAHVASWA